MDAERRVLAVPNLWQGFWKHLDWDRAVRDGMKEVGLEYSGKLDFIKTRMFWAINHEVVPKEQALRCADCHQAETVTCTRCHGQMTGIEPVELIGPTYPQSAGKRLDFVKLGYSGEPSLVGMRYRKRTLPCNPRTGGSTSDTR